MREKEEKSERKRFKIMRSKREEETKRKRRILLEIYLEKKREKRRGRERNGSRLSRSTAEEQFLSIRIRKML